MIIVIDNFKFNLDTNKIEDYYEIKNYVAIQKEKQRTKKRRAVMSILHNRKLINKYINTSDEELGEVLDELNKNRINLDRRGMFNRIIPFTI